MSCANASLLPYVPLVFVIFEQPTNQPAKPAKYILLKPQKSGLYPSVYRDVL